MSYLNEIKKIKPARIDCFLYDGDVKTVEVPRTSKSYNWKQLESILTGLSWERLEGYDKDDNLVWTYAQVTDDIQKDVEKDARDARLLEILTKAQRMVLSESRLSQQTLVKGFSDLADVLMQRIVHLEQKTIDMHEKFETLRQEAESEKQKDSDVSMSESLMKQLLTKVVDNIELDNLGSMFGGSELPAHSPPRLVSGDNSDGD
jgi:hypothetical protein